MWGRLGRTGGLLATAVGVAVTGSACAGTAPASAPFPSGEPVPVAYASVTTSAATTGVATLAGRELAEARGRTVADLLASRVPGVTVTRRGDGRVSVRVRGPSSSIGNREPLLVLDGVPVEHDVGGVLRDMRASDVARIEVLKDDASAAIFGVRGGNGVIMITTKRTR